MNNSLISNKLIKNENNVVDVDIKPNVSFYADPETLKEASGYYDHIKSVSLDAGKDTPWIENCTHCRMPMQMILLDPLVKLLGIPDSIYGENRAAKRSNGELVFQTWYNKWSANPVLNPVIDCWFCKGCSSVYTIVDGGYCWTKVSINGMDTFDSNMIPKYVSQQKEVILEEEFDPGPQPTPDSTVCPNCKVWRTVKEYNDTHVQHVCSKCKAVGLYKKEVQDKEVEEA
jgi:hypothetical protein